jgi:hypothetical protein
VSDFAFLPLQKLLNQRNPISRIETLERNRALPSARVGQLGQIGQSTGDMVVDGSIVVPNRTDGLADVTIDDNGVIFRNQEGGIFFGDTAGGGNAMSIYSDGADELVLQNAVGGENIRMDIDDPAHNVVAISFQYNGINIETGMHYYINSVPLAETLGAFLNSVQVPASTTYHGCPFKVGADAATNSFPIPQPGTLSNMNVRVSTAQPASGSLVCTLYKNNVATSIVVTIPAGSAGPATFSDTSNTASLSAGDIVRWVFQNNATAASATLIAVSTLLIK